MEYKFIPLLDNWFGQKIGELSDDELRQLFLEIHSFRRTGVLTSPSKLRELERDFSNTIQNHDGHLRIVEDEVLFEMSRRFYNNAAHQD